MKRVIGMLAAALLLLAGIPFSAAEPAVEIRTAAGLQAIREDLDGNYILMDNITLTGDFEPIGSGEDFPFIGVLDGNGYVIFGLRAETAVSGTAVSGLFGYNAGTIKNLSLADVEVSASGTDAYGNAYTYAGGIAAVNSGTITNCSVSGSVTGASAALTAYAGGLAGENTGTISECANYAAVQASGPSEGVAGGICGWNKKTVSDCYNNGTVESADPGSLALLRAGGIAGRNGYLSVGMISRSVNLGAVTTAGGTEQQVGGISGHSMGSVPNCYYDQALTTYNVGSAKTRTGALDRSAMNVASSFSALNFTDKWRMTYYPMLQNTRSFAPTLPGDVNLNGEVGISDAVLLLQVLVGRPGVTVETMDGDMNYDQRVSIADAVLLLQKLSA